MPRLAGPDRRRAHPARIQHHPRSFAEIEAIDWPGPFRHDRHVRTVHRSLHRRLADRQLRLAMDFLHQHSSRHRAHRHRLEQPPAGKGAPRVAARLGLLRDRHHGDRPGLARICFGRRREKGLVRQRPDLSILLDRRNLHHAFLYPRVDRQKALLKPGPLSLQKLHPFLRHPDGAGARTLRHRFRRTGVSVQRAGLQRE